MQELQFYCRIRPLTNTYKNTTRDAMIQCPTPLLRTAMCLLSTFPQITHIGESCSGKALPLPFTHKDDQLFTVYNV